MYNRSELCFRLIIAVHETASYSIDQITHMDRGRGKGILVKVRIAEGQTQNIRYQITKPDSMTSWVAIVFLSTLPALF